MTITPTLTAAIAETEMGWAGVALSETGIRYATLFHYTEASVTGELRAFGARPGDHPLAEQARQLLVDYAAGQPAPLSRHCRHVCYEMARPTATGRQRALTARASHESQLAQSAMGH